MVDIATTIRADFWRCSSGNVTLTTMRCCCKTASISLERRKLRCAESSLGEVGVARILGSYRSISLRCVFPLCEKTERSFSYPSASKSDTYVTRGKAEYSWSSSSAKYSSGSLLNRMADACFVRSWRSTTVARREQGVSIYLVDRVLLPNIQSMAFAGPC